MREVCIVSAVRTPIGRFQGAFSSLSAVELGTLVVKEAVARAHIDPSEVNEVLMGNVVTSGLGQNPARQTLIRAGLSTSIGATTINKVCGSGLKTVMLATQAIKSNEAEVVLAGGMESMTNVPYYLTKARSGYRLGNGEVVDGMVFDGLWDIYNNFHMGMTGEVVAEEYGVTREDADRLAFESHQKAIKATKEGSFKEQILPVDVKGRKGVVTTVTEDEGPRPDTSLEVLAKLRPVFKKDGLVTAGNASQISDGSSAVVVMSKDKAQEKGLSPLAYIRYYYTSGLKPELVMAAPIPGVKKVLEMGNFTIDDIDLFEHNEAFASASVAVKKECKVSDERFNVNGGAVALGHPIGCSGTRVLTTLLYAMKDRNVHRGLCTLCLGGGNAVTMIVERQ
ncbi:MAG: thiolase family protein [Promethearchaeota archaeon]